MSYEFSAVAGAAAAARKILTLGEGTGFQATQVVTAMVFQHSAVGAKRRITKFSSRHMQVSLTEILMHT